MRKFLIETAKVVGTATEKSWSQTHLFFPTDQEKLTKRGDLLAVLSLKGVEGGVESVAAGREIISRLHEEYYGNLEEKPLIRLKKAVERVQKEANSGAEVEIGAAAVVGGVLYLALTGEGRVLLQRDNQTGVLLQGSQMVKIASGYLQKDDLFLLGTTGFFKVIADGVIRAALAGGSPEEVVETLAPVVHGQAKSGTAAAVVGRVQPGPQADSLVPETKPQAASVSVDHPQAQPEPEKKAGPKSSLGSKLAKVLTAFQKRLGKRTIYLNLPQVSRQDWERVRKKKTERSPKKIFAVMGILILFLGLGVSLGAQRRKSSGVKQKATAFLAEARVKKEEGEALIELNPAQARELLLEAQSLAGQAQAEGLETEEFKNFLAELEEALDAVIKERQVEASLFFDLELIKQGARGDDWALSGERLFILDRGNNSVYELGLNDKKYSILAGGKSLNGAVRIAAFLPKIFVWTNQAVIEIDRSTKKENQVIDSPGETVSFQAFSANLYSLGQKGVWQFPATEDGFGEQRAWSKDKDLDFGGAKSMTIDGSIWVLKESGSIWKFTRGKKDAFGVAGLDQPLSNPSGLYTSEDQDNLYLLDKGNSRIVVLAKTGEYQATYLWEGIAQVEDLVVSEEAAKIWLLAGSKIYQMEIK